MRRLPSLLVAAGTLLMLTACAQTDQSPADPPSTDAETPTVDLDAGQRWLDEVRDSESDGPGGAGFAGLQVSPETGPPGDEGVRIDFANPTTVTRADARCFGGADIAVQVTVQVFITDDEVRDVSDWVPCDEDAHSIDLGAVEGSAVTVHGESDTITYLHVTVIEGMTVER